MTSVDGGCVLDASALLCLLQGEPGAAAVERAISGSVLSAVNWAEVVQKAHGRGLTVEDLRAELESLGLAILPFTAEDAERAAALWPLTRSAGLSLGDRACLALAARLDRRAFTTDRAWARVDAGIEVIVVR